MKIRDQVDLIGNNFQDIMEWAKAKRPDIVSDLDQLKKSSAIILLMSVAYAAGRASVIAEVEKTTITEVVQQRGG